MLQRVRHRPETVEAVITRSRHGRGGPWDNYPGGVPEDPARCMVSKGVVPPITLREGQAVSFMLFEVSGGHDYHRFGPAL